MKQHSPRSETSTAVPLGQSDLDGIYLGFWCNILAKEADMSALAITPPTASPDLAAYRKAVSDSFPEVVKGLTSIISRKLTAYIASVTDARALERWINHSTPHGDVEARLRHAYRVALMLSEHDSNAVVQAWLLGLNPELQDEVPLQLLREGTLEGDGKRVLVAARAFVAGG
jgi:hypothetical protein